MVLRWKRQASLQSSYRLPCSRPMPMSQLFYQGAQSSGEDDRLGDEGKQSRSGPSYLLQPIPSSLSLPPFGGLEPDSPAFYPLYPTLSIFHPTLKQDARRSVLLRVGRMTNRSHQKERAFCVALATRGRTQRQRKEAVEMLHISPCFYADDPSRCN